MKQGHQGRDQAVQKDRTDPEDWVEDREDREDADHTEGARPRR